MRGRTIYIIGVTLFLVVFVLLSLRMPKRFTWSASFDTADPQPYGCYVFDSLMRQTMPHGYTVTDKTLTQLRKEKAAPRSILVTTCGLSMDSLDLLSLQQLAEGGNRVLVTCQWTPSYDVQNKFFSRYGVYFFEESYRSSWAVSGNAAREDVYWRTDSLYGMATYQPSSILMDSYLVVDTLQTITPLAFIVNGCDADSICLPVLRRGSEDEVGDAYAYASEDGGQHTHPVAVTCRVGEGEIVFASTPLLFTNYGILMPETREYVLRLLNTLADRPVVRTTAYLPNRDFGEPVHTDGATGFFLQHPPLRTALQLAGLLVVLLMVFKARRRQRAIPVYHAPANRSLEFVQLIGTLYYQRHDNLDLMRKKYRIFAETLRRRLDIDVMTAKDEPSDVDTLAQRTHLVKGYLRQVLRGLREAYFGGLQLGDVQMKRMLEQMNEIIERI